MSTVDTRHPVPIGDRVYWVGHLLPGDPFQCHVYLVEHGDQSVLIDPGSMLTLPHVLDKLQEILPLRNIRYFVCQHQDPDITGAMPFIDRLLTRDDAVLVTHWRAAALLKHLALRIPFWQIETHDWRLDLGGRVLDFVLTPYLHFPGAFCTFDATSGTLFSSDLFGGFTPEPRLFAEDESYFEQIRSFHEHYMPSRDILLAGMLRLEGLPIRQIAPQHGSIVPERLVRYVIDRLKGLECGIYLLSRHDTDIQRLMQLNALLRELTQQLVVYQDFRDVAQLLLAKATEILPVETLEFWDRRDGAVVQFAPRRYQGVEAVPPADLAEVLRSSRAEWLARHGKNHAVVRRDDGTLALLLPLHAESEGAIHAVTVFQLREAVEVTDELDSILGRIGAPLAVALEREAIHHALEHERARLYERSIRDPLTGLYTRRYFDEASARLVALHDRDPAAAFAMAMLDVDHFKRVNDTYGHPAGDAVLRAVGETIARSTRGSDIAVRFGGEEFAVFLAAPSVEGAVAYAERVRLAVAALELESGGRPLRVTLSAGVAVHRRTEKLADLVQRADAALYAAKTTGRNRTCAGE